MIRKVNVIGLSYRLVVLKKVVKVVKYLFFIWWGLMIKKMCFINGVNIILSEL